MSSSQGMIVVEPTYPFGRSKSDHETSAVSGDKTGLTWAALVTIWIHLNGTMSVKFLFWNGALTGAEKRNG